MQCIAMFIKSVLKVWVTQSTKQNISENCNTNWPHYWHDLLSSTHPFKCRRPEKYCLRSYTGKYKTTRALLLIEWIDHHNMQYNRLQSVLKWGGMDGMLCSWFLVLHSAFWLHVKCCSRLSNVPPDLQTTISRASQRNKSMRSRETRDMSEELNSRAQSERQGIVNESDMGVFSIILSNPVPWHNWMAAYLSYTLWMKTLFHGWPIMVNDTHRRRCEILPESTETVNVQDSIPPTMLVISRKLQSNVIWDLNLHFTIDPDVRRITPKM